MIIANEESRIIRFGTDSKRRPRGHAHTHQHHKEYSQGGHVMTQTTQLTLITTTNTQNILARSTGLTLAGQTHTNVKLNKLKTLKFSFSLSLSFFFLYCLFSTKNQWKIKTKMFLYLCWLLSTWAGHELGKKKQTKRCQQQHHHAGCSLSPPQNIPVCAHCNIHVPCLCVDLSNAKVCVASSWLPHCVVLIISWHNVTSCALFALFSPCQNILCSLRCLRITLIRRHNCPSHLWLDGQV